MWLHQNGSGGYNVALGGGDTVERHFMDTIIGGVAANQDMAWRLCNLAVERITELENEIGCFFDRNEDGTFIRKRLLGKRRIEQSIKVI